MNQYITISGVHPFWINGLHAAVSSLEGQGKDDMPPVLLRKVHWMEHHHSYVVELECPLEYFSEEKKLYHPSGKGLMSVFTALGLYGEKEKILTGDVPPEFSGTMDVKIKITGVFPERLSWLFTMCNGSRARSMHRQRLGEQVQELHEIVYMEIKFADWNRAFSTFTVQLYLTARQGFNGKTNVLHSSPLGAASSMINETAVLLAPRSVLESIYDALGVYVDVRSQYHWDDD